MKICFCPNCGRKVSAEIGAQSKIVLLCAQCGRSLMVKMEKDALTIKAQGTARPDIR